MGDPVLLLIAVAALVLASLHAVWVAKRHVNHEMAGRVVARLLGKGDLGRATKLCRAADDSAFFQALRVSLVEAASIRADAPAMLAGSYRERPGRRDQGLIEASLQETFEARLAVAEGELAKRRRIALGAALIALGVPLLQMTRGGLSPVPPAIAGLAFLVAVWSARRSWLIPRHSRREIVGLLPLIAKCAVDGASAPDTAAAAAPRPDTPVQRDEGALGSTSPRTPVTSWPEEHGLFYAFEDDRCGELQARIAAIVNERLAGKRLRVADLARIGGEAPNRPARLLAVLGDRESIAAYVAEIARRRDEGSEAPFPDVLCASEPPPSRDLAESFGARRAYFDVRAAVATGEYEALAVEEPLG